MVEILFYFAIGTCAGIAQHLRDDQDLYKVPVVAVCWPAVVVITLFLLILKVKPE